VPLKKGEIARTPEKLLPHRLPQHFAARLASSARPRSRKHVLSWPGMSRRVLTGRRGHAGTVGEKEILYTAFREFVLDVARTHGGLE